MQTPMQQRHCLSLCKLVRLTGALLKVGNQKFWYVLA